MKSTVRALSHVFVACLLTFGASRSARAQGFAVRSGANINPDQFSVGSQYELGPINDRLWLQPNTDLGVGNDATLIAMNFDVVYRRPVSQRSIWTAYAGGGPALDWYRLLGYSRTVAGANVVAGVMHHGGLFSEMRVGFLESPQLRFGVG